MEKDKALKIANRILRKNKNNGPSWLLRTLEERREMLNKNSNDFMIPLVDIYEKIKDKKLWLLRFEKEIKKIISQYKKDLLLTKKK